MTYLKQFAFVWICVCVVQPLLAKVKAAEWRIPKAESWPSTFQDPGPHWLLTATESHSGDIQDHIPPARLCPGPRAYP